MELKVTTNEKAFEIETRVQDWETHELLGFLFQPAKVVQQAASFPLATFNPPSVMMAEIGRVHAEVVAEINARIPKPKFKMGSYSYAHHDDYDQ